MRRQTQFVRRYLRGRIKVSTSIGFVILVVLSFYLNAALCNMLGKSHLIRCRGQWNIKSKKQVHRAPE